MTRSPAERLGERLRNDLPDVAQPANYAALRNRLVEAAVSEPRRRQRLWMGAAAAALLVVALPLAFLGARATYEDAPAALSFRAGASGNPGAVGTYYTATDSQTLPLAFSDGSRVALDKNAGVRVTETDRARTAVLLETGSADFDIVHHDRRSWDVLAGPYRVHVTGTAFRLSWDPSQRWLRLAMRSGSVIVTGPGIETGVTVRGGAQFETRVTTGVTSPGDGKAASPSEERALSRAPADLPAPAAAVRDGVDRRADTTPALPHASSQAGSPTMRVPEPTAPQTAEPGAADAPAKGPQPSAARSGGGTYDAVVARAEARGISAFLGSESSSELRNLADAARFTGRLGLCERALHAVRARFPSTPDAAWASFVLGKLAEDSGRLRQALGYYEEAAGSGSSLRAEALGRKMVALHRLGEHAQAEAVARQYLERYADGPYARQARELAPK